MIRVLDEKYDGLTADVVASVDQMSSYTVYALGSSERVVLPDTRRLLDTSQFASTRQPILLPGQISNNTG